MALPIDLAQKQAAEIAKAEAFSFDFKKFESEMVGGDLLTLIIRAHLYVEHALIQMLCEAMTYPNEEVIRRLNFPSKLELCIAFALIPDEWKPAVLKVNEMRNRMAHRLEALFLADERLNLFRMFPEPVQKLALEEVGETDPKRLSWGHVLRVLPIAMDIWRQQKAVERVRGKISHERLRRVLDNKG